MKKAISTLCFLLVLFFIQAQTPNDSLPNKFANPNSPNGYYRIGYIKSDSGTILAVRDTTSTTWGAKKPRYAGTTVEWQHSGTDTSIWHWNGRKWLKLIDNTNFSSTFFHFDSTCNCFTIDTATFNLYVNQFITNGGDTSTNIVNIYDNSIVGYTIIHDTCVSINLGSGISLDTVCMSGVTQITSVQFLSDSCLLACGPSIADTTVQICDTLCFSNPNHKQLYIFDNMLTQVIPGHVEFGGNATHTTAIDVSYYKLLMYGRTIQDYPYDVKQYQSWGNSSGIMSFGNSSNTTVRYGMNWVDSTFRTVGMGGFIPGPNHPYTGLFFGGNGTYRIADPNGDLQAEDVRKPTVGIFLHEDTSGVAFDLYGIKWSTVGSGVGPTTGPITSNKIITGYINKDVRFPFYGVGNKKGIGKYLLAVNDTGLVKESDTINLAGREFRFNVNTYTGDITKNTFRVFANDTNNVIVSTGFMRLSRANFVDIGFYAHNRTQTTGNILKFGFGYDTTGQGQYGGGGHAYLDMRDSASNFVFESAGSPDNWFFTKYFSRATGLVVLGYGGRGKVMIYGSGAPDFTNIGDGTLKKFNVFGSSYLSDSIFTEDGALKPSSSSSDSVWVRDASTKQTRLRAQSGIYPTLQQVFNTEVGGSVLTKLDSIQCGSSFGLNFYTSGSGNQINFIGSGAGGIVGMNSTGGAPLTLTMNPSSTNTVATILPIRRQTSGTAAAGIGGSLEFSLEVSNGNLQSNTNSIQSILTDVTPAAPISKMVFTGMNTTSSSLMELAGAGQMKLNYYTSASAFAGTPVASLAVDASGNVLTSNLLITGTYEPTLTSVTNVTANTSYSTTKYTRVGNMVTVFGKFQIDPTGAGAVEMGISLPIASTLSGDDDVSGEGSSTNITGEVLTILADVANARATVKFNATDTSNRTVYFTFHYQIK